MVKKTIEASQIYGSVAKEIGKAVASSIGVDANDIILKNKSEEGIMDILVFYKNEHTMLVKVENTNSKFRVRINAYHLRDLTSVDENELLRSIMKGIREVLRTDKEHMIYDVHY
ncbi:MAG: hypothetical protein ACP5SA_00235 [Candidatus Micrarchaeia archaeon]